MNELVSIIVPFKNEEVFLGECLKSIQDQIIEDFSIEVILIDDFSVDSSYSIAKDHCDSDSRFFLYRNERSGVIEALKQGLTQSRGKYIHRMDADDIMPPDKILNLIQVLRSNTDVQVATGKVRYFATDKNLEEGYLRYEKWLNERIENSDFYSEIYKECPVASPNWLISKTNFLSAGGFDSVYPEDYDLVFSWMRGGFKIGGTEKVTHLWRDHANRSSRVSELYSDNSFVQLKVLRFIENKDFRGGVGVYGAGKKAKKIVRELLNNSIQTRWFTSNPKKIGQNIFGVILESESDFISDPPQSMIVGVSGPKDLRTLKENFEGLSGIDFTYFF